MYRWLTPLFFGATAWAHAAEPPPGFTALFNGKDLTGWKADAEARRHWTVRGGVLDYDGRNKDLWTDKEFGDFTLMLGWRWSGKAVEVDHPLIGADGHELKGPDGTVKTQRVLDGGDSGVFLRGFRKAQANLFCYPVGSGEVWEYRTDAKMPADVRRAVTPRKRADKAVGEWNEMIITMKGDRLTVVLNGEEVISRAQLPGVPPRGAIGLQHEHGTIQFRDLFIRELTEDDKPKPEPRVPEGFVIRRVAGEREVRFPMFAAFDDHGRLYVAESSGLDLYKEITAGTRNCRVSRLEDRDGDGTFEISRVFADRLVFPMGLAWRQGKLYVADPPDLVTLEDTDGDGAADKRTVILTGFGHLDNGSLHGLTFGPDGWLYMTMGSPDGYKLKRRDGTFLEGKSGALIRCRPDGSEPEVLSRGFVNLVEVAFTARGDAIGTDNFYRVPSGGVRDALVHCVDGGLYPYLPDTGTPYPVTGAPLPATTLFPAAAVSGITCYQGAALPAAMRGNLFVAQHNTRQVSRHTLVPDGATFRTEDHVFVTSDDPDFRPSDILEAADGSLLVIDTGSWYVHHCPTGRVRDSHARGGIYRVRPAKWSAPDDPWGRKVDWAAGERELTKLLGDSRPAVRDRAGQELSHRGAAAVPALEAMLTGNAPTPIKQTALWALARIEDAAALPPLRRTCESREPELLIPAARALGLRRDRQSATSLAGLLVAESPAVRLAAAEALARCGGPEELPALRRALADAADRFLEHALVHGFHHLAGEAALREALTDRHGRVRKAALLLLDQPPRPKGALESQTVIRRVSDEDEGVREAALTVLAKHPEWGSQAVDLLRGWLRQPKLTGAELVGLQSLILAFQGQPTVQELVGRALDKRSDTPPERQGLLLETLARTGQAEIPGVWVHALAAALERDEAVLLGPAVRTAAVLQVSKLDDRLALLAEDIRVPVELRLEALRGVALRRPRLSVASFTLVREQLGEKADPVVRLAAAELLGALA